MLIPAGNAPTLELLGINKIQGYNYLFSLFPSHFQIWQFFLFVLFCCCCLFCFLKKLFFWLRYLKQAMVASFMSGLFLFNFKEKTILFWRKGRKESSKKSFHNRFKSNKSHFKLQTFVAFISLVLERAF